MPARIGPKKPVRVYLSLWREADLPGMSQEKFGQRFHPPVDKGTVSRWENATPGRLSLGVIAAYAEALGRNPADLYRRPSEGPSLDALASQLDPEARESVIGVISAMAARKRA